MTTAVLRQGWPFPGRFAALTGLAVLLLAAQSLPGCFALIRQYAHSAGPYRDVQISDADADLYWVGPGAAKLPKGVSNLRFDLEPGGLTGSALVDFDQLARNGNANPLLSLFSGTHTIQVRTRLVSGSAPAVRLAVTEVRMDGRVLPQLLVDAALAAFVTPRHPAIGRSFTVPLPTHALAAEFQTGDVVIHYPHE